MRAAAPRGATYTSFSPDSFETYARERPSGENRGIASKGLYPAIDPLNSDNIYVGIRSHGILRSSDGGNTWTAADTGLTDERITAIALDPRDPRILYAAAAGGGVFRSTDGARTWHPFGTGLVHSADNVTAFAIGPSGRAVFAATEGDGVVRLGFGR